MVPKGWIYKSLEDVTKEKISYGIVQAGPHIDVGVPYIKSSDVGAEINVESLQKTAPEIHHKYRRSAVHPGDIILSLRGNLGRTSIVPPELLEANLTQGTARISVTSDNDTSFVRLQLSSELMLNLLDRLSKGSTFKEISLEVLRKVPILLPPLPEQRKIAQILSTWDKAIATTERLLANRQQQKKALMQRLLTGKQRFAGFEGEWKHYHVAQFGKVITGNTPPKSDNSNYGGAISWITAEDFKGKYVGNSNVKLSTTGAQKARLVSKGSVLVTCIASIGKNGIAAESLATNQQINAVEMNASHSNEFFYYLVEYYKHVLIACAGTTAVPILNKSNFEQIKFKAPLLDEQQKITSVLSLADDEIERFQQNINNLKQQKKALMQQLLTGKRRVKVDLNQHDRLPALVP